MKKLKWQVVSEEIESISNSIKAFQAKYPDALTNIRKTEEGSLTDYVFEVDIEKIK